MKSYRFFISGRVQGVFYRANVAKNAQSEGFSGYVRNLEDGRVEAAVSCSEEDLERFKTVLAKGSTASRVDVIEAEPIDELFNGAFEIRH
jgi:acylphosphatase